MFGIARTGGIASNSSGDFAIAVSTARDLRIPYITDSMLEESGVLRNDRLDLLFEAVIEATEEAIINSLFAAETVVAKGNVRIEALPVEKTLEKMKTKILLSLLLITGFGNIISAQQEVIPLWTGVAPGSEEWTQKEVQYLNEQGQQMVRNVVIPTLTAYKPDPDKANGTAVIVAPGGGFLFLSWQTEGTEVAEWLASKGVTAFLLKYRLTNSGSTQEEFQKAMIALFSAISAASNPDNAGKSEGDINRSRAMSEIAVLGQEDGRQAIRIVRRRAAEWGIDPEKIGIMGFSAGGMVTLGPLLLHDAESRPDFAGAIYTPWSNSPVPDDAPPLFILAAGDDMLTAPGSIQMYSEWKKAGKKAELHMYSKGGHGFGMQKKGLPVDSWIERLYEWMVSQGF